MDNNDHGRIQQKITEGGREGELKNVSSAGNLFLFIKMISNYIKMEKYFLNGRFHLATDGRIFNLKN